MKKLNLTWVLVLSLMAVACAPSHPKTTHTGELPDLVMPDNLLKFKDISGYENYKLVATHYRNDKHELRYILANNLAIKALKQHHFPLPEGSKIVKIGWKTRKMPRFDVALEATDIQRIEYMIKDTQRFTKNPGGWGYARFVKQNGKYRAWDQGTHACIQCHKIAGKENDYLFSHFQKMF